MNANAPTATDAIARRLALLAGRSRSDLGLALAYLLVGATLLGGTGWGLALAVADPAPYVVEP